MKLKLSKKIICLVMTMALASAAFFYIRQVRNRKVSEFGRYQGYSEEVYDGHKRISDYLKLPDETRLAYDLFLPTKDGIPADRRLPVLFQYTPYPRTFTIFDKGGNNLIAELLNFGWKEKAFLRIRYWLSDEGHLVDSLFSSGWLNKMLKHGYVIVVVERSGSGASFGVTDPTFELAASEGSKILDWIASQPWCDGNIGMFGGSMRAMQQFAVAASGNPRLKTIFPVSSCLDLYSSILYRGGVYNKAFSSFFSEARSRLRTMITPVDSDQDGVLLAQALKGRTVSDIFREYPFRDAVLEDGTNLWEDRAALYPFIERINRIGIPIYMTTGWYDLFPEEMLFWHDNLAVPKRLTIRPLDHSGIDDKQFDLDYGAEAHRWFDRWLKGIDNGIMDESPIHYFVMSGKKKGSWQTSSQWPLAARKLKRFYLSGQENTTSDSTDGGLLTNAAPVEQDACDTHTIDYTTTSGKNSRWTAVNWPRDYPDMKSNDRKALTYTMPPLERDIEITGHPVLNLWLKTDASDLDVFAYLEEVNAGGKSTYITEGNLRASHRKLRQAPYRNLGLPYHSHYRGELMPVPAGEPIELTFSLLPTSYRFKNGDRIRITIAFADADNFETPIINPAPRLQLLRSAKHPSWIQLPIVN